MTTKLRYFCILLALIAGVCQTFAQGTAFIYQGQLASGGAPANGSYDLTFTLFATNSGGSVIAGPVTNSATGVTNGLFAATIDFGAGVFTGGNYWLQLAVRTNGGGSFTNLSPRQPILPVPYAIMADSASNLLGTLPAAQLSGSLPATQISGTIPLTQLPGAVLTNNASGVFLNGGFNGYHSGDGSGLTNLNPLSIDSGYVAAQLLATNQFNFFSGGFNGYHSGNGNGLTNLNPLSIASGYVAAQLLATNQFNFFSGGFNGYHSGDGGGLTNLNPLSIDSGYVAAQLLATNQFNFFNGSFNGYHSGNGNGLTNLNPLSIASGYVAAQLLATNQFNFFSGGFNGYHSGDGGGLTNLNPLSIDSGYVAAQLLATNQFNFFDGGFNGYHSGDGSGLTNLNPLSIASGNVAAQLSATNQFNAFSGSFNGSHSGDGSGLTNLNPVVFGTLTPDATGTNFTIPCAINNIRYDNVTLATNINVVGIANWSGAGSLKILTAPAVNLIFTCPTNWFALNTNGLVVAGAYWTETIPSNHMGWLSWEKDTGNGQANVTFTFTVSP